MKTYEGKTLDDVIQHACQDLGITPDELTYEIIEEKKGLFSKKVVIECYCESMVQEYLESFVRKTLTNMGFQVETVSYIQDGRIYCNINTDNNSILIGKGGVILRAFNLIARQAVQNEFKKRFEISLDINGYRETRYKKVSAMAKRLGKQVLRTKIAVKLDPLPADERKVVHQTIADFNKHLKTESQGEGKDRFTTISYVD
ncbi:protein jag [Massilimicrobiota timonensis]|uniref:Protein jag n=1 Tax=Massilimicrobiota timonensis TaxID=1776392 RepID=A0A1Y4T339_9FIRM|nr:R3H domain-containing nucleic acid-binding protein [Massilimicrobiota timonensis]MBM6966797.1 Jag N-terminal domain-containing protein [Massilimicrobiota timonensis]OUQ36617.1 protein jag [Massilimicrobiota timonensis]